MTHFQRFINEQRSLTWVKKPLEGKGKKRRGYEEEGKKEEKAEEVKESL